MGIDIFKTGNGDFYKLTEDGVKQILGTPVSEIDKDAVNPNHYKNQCSLVCIDSMIMAFGSEFVYHFCICNAWKYMWRYQNKNGVEDIEKARWYVNKASELIPEYLEWQNINEVLKTIERDMIERGIL
jgi:hypothetical protein